MRRSARFALLSAMAVAVGCGDGSGGGGGSPVTAPEIGTRTVLVPSAAMPARIMTQGANNNLDVVRHGGRVYLAFRTAPTHFASTTTTLYVVSSADQEAWSYEAEFIVGRDIREPRFLSFGGRLFLYFAVLGANPLDFEPGETRVTEFLGAGDWTPSEHVYEDGFIPWRAKVVGGTPYVVGYIGGENIYDFNAEPIDVHFLTTANGRDLAPAVPGKPVVLRGGCSETDFVVLDDGSLLAVSRNEAGDELGWGMKICKAPANDWGTWLCVADPRKYDSPLLFKRGADVYLIGRRNLTETGNFDLGLRQYDSFLQTILYSLDYWGKGKRTSLWKVDPATLEVSFALDFPSRGDTSFAGLLEEADGAYTVYNYSSPPGKEEIGWLTGQLNPTEIYRIPLRLP